MEDPIEKKVQRRDRWKGRKVLEYFGTVPSTLKPVYILSVSVCTARECFPCFCVGVCAYEERVAAAAVRC